MNITIKNLEMIQELENTSTLLKKIVDILLLAINDWPNDVTNLFEYENQILLLIKKELNKKNLEKYLSEVDYSKNAWEAESLSQLLDIYSYYNDDKLLKDIFREIGKEIISEDGFIN